MSSVSPAVAHDLILVLLGFTGDIFERDATGEELIISNSFSPTFEEWDKCVLKRILHTANLYMRIRDWVDSVVIASSDCIDKRGLADSISTIVLKDYEDDIAQLEEEILFLSSDTTSFKLSLTNMKSKICDKWNCVFENFYPLIDGEKNEENVIDLLIDMEQHCVDELSLDKIGQVKSVLMSIFFRQVYAWTVLGVNSPRGNQPLFSWSKKLFDDRFVERLEECGQFVKLMNLKSTSRICTEELPSEIGTNNFFVSEKMKSFVDTKWGEINQRMIEYMKRAISPNLYQYLEILRGIFLLGHGDLWDEYILRKKDVSVFGGGEREDIVERLERGILMEVGPVIGLIIHPGHVAKYVELWRWLLGIKQCLVNLSNQFSKSSTTVASVMIQFVSHFFAFVQQDVIEEEWARFLSVVDSPGASVADIKAAHDKCLGHVLAESLFSFDSVRNGIERVLKHCDRFKLGNAAEAREAEYAFMREVAEFIQNLNVIRMRVDFRRIERLLLRLDFNGFYTRIRE